MLFTLVILRKGESNFGFKICFDFEIVHQKYCGFSFFLFILVVMLQNLIRFKYQSTVTPKLCFFGNNFVTSELIRIS